MGSELRYETLLVDRDDGVTTVTFNRPDKRNAMNPRLHADMYDVLNVLEGDEETRVLVLTGAGKAFCAGQDLKEYFQEVENDAAQFARNKRQSNDWRNRMLPMFPKPTIAMINGFCFGGAFPVVAACDFAIAADEAVFGLSEINFGAYPGGMVSKVITAQMPFRDALYYSMTGETFDGKRAEQMRWINRSVPLAQLRDEVMSLARKLATLDAAALQTTKEAVKQVVEMSHDEAFWWLLAKGNELKWRHHQAGEGGGGIDQFLAKEYRPGLGSFDPTKK